MCVALLLLIMLARTTSTTTTDASLLAYKCFPSRLQMLPFMCVALLVVVLLLILLLILLLLLLLLLPKLKRAFVAGASDVRDSECKGLGFRI